MRKLFVFVDFQRGASKRREPLRRIERWLSRAVPVQRHQGRVCLCSRPGEHRRQILRRVWRIRAVFTHDENRLRSHKRFVQLEFALRQHRVEGVHSQRDRPKLRLQAAGHILFRHSERQHQLGVLQWHPTQGSLSHLILFISTNKVSQQVIADKQGMVEGLAYDSQHETLYWTCNSDSSISKALVNSNNMTVEKVVRLTTEDKPRGIALDPCDS